MQCTHVYTKMPANRSELVIAAALDRNEIALKEVTRSQYASQLRDFYRWLEGRSARRLRFESVQRYVEEVRSGWARRRAVSALGSLYRYFRRPDVGDRLRACGYGRPGHGKRRSLSAYLRRLNWSTDALQTLRWSDVLRSYLSDERVCNVGPRSYRLDHHARAELRSLICRRFASTQRLLGKALFTGRVFSGSDFA
jgi:hypothetical protein